MRILYNFLIKTAEKALPAIGVFNPRIKAFYSGRKTVFGQLKIEIPKHPKLIWVHAASLGEYEQAVPVLKAIRKDFPQYRILISFFSPSGYEAKKRGSLADVVTYLPLDTSSNAKKFLDLVQPRLAIFIKYEFWPNYLAALQEMKIPTLLVSGSFRRNQVFFKAYGKWMIPYLRSFDHFFVQNEQSKELLRELGFTNVTRTGDTRFDRVFSQLEQDNTVETIDYFVQGQKCLVCGSTWPEDEELLLPFINKSPSDLRIIIAPHQIDRKKIESLKSKLQRPVALFTEAKNPDLARSQVLILDTIGLLAKAYSYADIAYVGGAAGTTGLHNILEAATFGVPVITGKNIDKFPEALELQKEGGLFSVSGSAEAADMLHHLMKDQKNRSTIGEISAGFVRKRTGATSILMRYLHQSDAL